MDIFEELKKVPLPRDTFVVLGSGILGALGIRPIGDIDMLVTPEVFDRLRSEGWKYEIIQIEGKPREKISSGKIEAFKDFWVEHETLSAEEGIARAQKINGYNFVPLEILRKYKKLMAREKDLQDIELIDEYLQMHS